MFFSVFLGGFIYLCLLRRCNLKSKFTFFYESVTIGSGRRLHCPSATASAAKRFMDLGALNVQWYVGLRLLSLVHLACPYHILPVRSSESQLIWEIVWAWLNCKLNTVSLEKIRVGYKKCRLVSDLCGFNFLNFHSSFGNWSYWIEISNQKQTKSLASSSWARQYHDQSTISNKIWLNCFNLWHCLNQAGVLGTLSTQFTGTNWIPTLLLSL